MGAVGNDSGEVKGGLEGLINEQAASTEEAAQLTSRMDEHNKVMDTALPIEEVLNFEATPDSPPGLTPRRMIRYMFKKLGYRESDHMPFNANILAEINGMFHQGAMAVIAQFEDAINGPLEGWLGYIEVFHHFLRPAALNFHGTPKRLATMPVPEMAVAKHMELALAMRMGSDVHMTDLQELIDEDLFLIWAKAFLDDEDFGRFCILMDARTMAGGIGAYLERHPDAEIPEDLKPYEAKARAFLAVVEKAKAEKAAEMRGEGKTAPEHTCKCGAKDDGCAGTCEDAGEPILKFPTPPAAPVAE